MKKIFMMTLTFITVFITGFSVKANEPVDLPDIVYKQADKVLLVSDILSWYGASDATVILDEYSGFGNIPKNYNLVIELSGIRHELVISVRNALSNVADAVAKMGDEYHILVTKDKQLTKENIRDILVNINVIDPSWFISINHMQFDAYSKNWNAPGKYNHIVTAASSSGLSNEHQVSVIVSNNEGNPYDFSKVKNNSTVNIFWIIAISIVGVTVTFTVIDKKTRKK